MVLATGSEPFVPPIPDTRLGNVFTVKKDVNYLNSMLDTLDGAKDLVIIGGGFIGVEFADECRKRENLNVSIIELLPHCLLLACDEEICIKAEDKLKEHGVNVLADSRAQAIVGNGKVEHIQLAGGEKLKADAVIMGIGVAPNSDLAQAADLKVDERSSIYVDEFMRTNDESILAAGDCARKTSFFTGGPSRLMLASIASIESRVAGANLFTLRRRNEHAIGVFSTVIGELCIGSAGMTERAAREAGFDIVVGEASSPNRHPAGMPGVDDVSVKLVFSRESRTVLGGQILGGSSVGEAINIIGATIQMRMRADDIATFQVGTHPALTASPIAYQITNAAEIALTKMR
jgi:pyruvate/2-oxoglutarate dehydrogenase complex dihydrolipoamide dehydrogenase (E3) component